MKQDMYLQLKQSKLIAIQIKREVLFLAKYFDEYVSLLFMFKISFALFSFLLRFSVSREQNTSQILRTYFVLFKENFTGKKYENCILKKLLFIKCDRLLIIK